MTLGKRIAARRRALGWSQNELARRAEVNHPTLYKIEADQRLNPSISVVVRIARALGTSAEALYGLERENRLLVEANKASMIVEVRPLGQKLNEAARTRAQAFVTGALERAGARVREAGANAGEHGAEEPLLPSDAAHLATGGLALVDEIAAIRRRLDMLEAWRRAQEGRARKRASR